MTEKTNYVQGKTGEWEIVIGLEVHAQVVSRTKLFSSAPIDFGKDPNCQVTFFDAGMPGMLPVVNTYCVDQAIKTGLGLNAKVNLKSIFDRKNYFYPDLPSGYQISQFHKPIVSAGYLDIDLEEGITKRITINRLHLEQDAGKSIHDLHPSKSYIDLNRSGIALMEIVSDPDIRSVAEAQSYVKKLRTILQYLGTCDGNMEQGSLRVDANISLRRPGAPFNNRVEIKNVNSIRFLGQALEYEIERQLEILESDGTVIQETRLFDPNKCETRSMRTKENAHDYRYFPDPDLAPLVLTLERIENLRSQMPELPDAKKERFISTYELPLYDALLLVSEREIAEYFEATIKSSRFANDPTKLTALAKLGTNWITGELFALINKDNLTIASAPIPASHMAKLVDLILDETISGKIAKDVFTKMWETQEDPAQIVEKLGLQQITNPKEIEDVIEKILSTNTDKVDEYRSGKDKLFGFFVGLVMKEMKGKGNPTLINDILKQKLNG